MLHVEQPRESDGIHNQTQQNHNLESVLDRKLIQAAIPALEKGEAYYPQWDFLQDLMIQVDVGQFLAGDVGTQINVSKQFKSGVIAGAFASFTDLSAEEFGEGSFTKGFYLSIPFDIMTVKPSNNRANFSWQPLTRDGGQKLGRKYNLIELTDERNPWYQRPNTSPVK